MSRRKIQRIDPDTYRAMMQDIKAGLTDAQKNTQGYERHEVGMMIYHIECIIKILNGLEQYYQTHKRR